MDNQATRGQERKDRACCQAARQAQAALGVCARAAHPHLLCSQPNLVAQHSLHVFSWVLAHCNQPVTVRA